MKFIREEESEPMRRGSKMEKNIFIYCIINNFSNRKICKLMNLSYFRVLQFKKELALTLFEKGIKHDVICKNLNIKSTSLYMYKDPHLNKETKRINSRTIQVYPKEKNIEYKKSSNSNSPTSPVSPNKNLKIDELLLENFQKLEISQGETTMIDRLIQGIEKI